MPGEIDHAGATIYRKFTSRSGGAPATLSGSPVVSIYKDDSLTQSTAGVTLTVDFDGLTGLNHVSIDTSASSSFYTNGSHFDLVITTGTVGGDTVAGEVVGSFDLSAANGPSTGGVNVTQWNGTNVATPNVAGYPLIDLAKTRGTDSAGQAGYIGLDWGQIANKTTSNALTGTTISTSQVVASVSGAVGSVTGAVGSVTGNVGGSVGSVVGAVGSVTGNVGGSVASVVGAVGSVTGNVGGNIGGNVTGSVGSVAASVAVGSIDGPALAQFFTDDSGTTYASAVDGSVVKEIATNSAGGGGGGTDVNVISIADNVITAASIAASALNGKGDWLTSLGTHPPADWINAASIEASALNGKGDWSTLTAGQVWTNGTRTLTSGTNIVLAKGVGLTGFNDLDAAGIRTAVGLASANLDTQLATIPSTAAIADKFLGRNIAGASDGGRTVAQAFAFLRNKWDIAGGILTVKATNDTTTLWTAVVTTTPGDNVTSIDPS